ncbi:hypothetical protein PAPHI01_2021 [Pancytospora philotis]|nr:hypothetical protein PAPHI01_2021 [Pancytospora philotis]
MVALAYLIAFVPLMAVYAFNIIAHRHQLNYYIAHADVEVPKWAAYGIPENSYERSKYYLGMFMLRIHNEMLYTMIHLLPFLLMALPFSIWDMGALTDTLWEAAFYSTTMWKYAKVLRVVVLRFNLLSNLVLLSSVALSIFVLGRKYGLAACCAVLFLSSAATQGFCMHLFEGNNYINSISIPISNITQLSEYKDLDGGVKSTILEICKAGGISQEYVLVDHDDDYGAICSSGLRWGYVVINTGMLKRGKIEHICATLMHELEHYKRMHVPKSSVYNMAVHLLFCAAIYFLYRKTHMHFGRPCLAIISWVWVVAFANLAPLIANGCWSIRHEYEADIGTTNSKYGAYTKSHLVALAILGNGGMLFDVNYPYTITRTHPSNYNRIQAHEKRAKK